MFSTKVKSTHYLLSDIARNLLCLLLLPPSSVAFPVSQGPITSPTFESISWKGPDVQYDRKSFHPLFVQCQPANQKISPEDASSKVETLNRLEPKALPLDWVLNPNKAARLESQEDKQDLDQAAANEVFDRILARLTLFETHESNPHLRDDLRISWLTVRFCQTGEAVMCTPHVLATYNVLGCHPDQVWFRMQQHRKALLGDPTFIKIGAATGNSAAPTGAAPHRGSPPAKAAPVSISKKGPKTA